MLRIAAFLIAFLISLPALAAEWQPGDTAEAGVVLLDEATAQEAVSVAEKYGLRALHGFLLIVADETMVAFGKDNKLPPKGAMPQLVHGVWSVDLLKLVKDFESREGKVGQLWAIKSSDPDAKLRWVLVDKNAAPVKGQAT